MLPPLARAGNAATRAHLSRRTRAGQLPDAWAECVRILGWTAWYLVRWLLGSRTDKVRLARLVRSYLLRMGPLYVKAGQVLGTQSAVLSKEATDEFRSFFSDLDPMPSEAVRAVLVRSFGGPVSQVFESFDETPVAVGSVAQVHRAVLRDGGGPVAVKIVKEGVREQLAASTRALGAVFRLLGLVPALRKYDLAGHFAELRPLITGQCDMRAEAKRQTKVARNFRNHPFLSVPATHAELCTEDVLVMEFVPGVRGQDWQDADFPPDKLAARLLDVFYCMVYFHGFFHVDPHPGNIFFGPGGRIILLDFGLVGELSEEDKWNVSSFYYACVRKQWELAAERFTRAFVVRPELLERNREAYEANLHDILRLHFEKQTAHWSTMAFLDDATRLLRSYGARVSTRFSLLSLSLLTGEGFLSHMDPGIDIWRNARRFTDRFSPYLSDELRELFEQEIGARTPRSTDARADATRYLVAPTHLDRFVLPSAFPLVVARAEGARLTDVDGNTYIDLSCGYGPHILGYGHPAVVAAIEQAASAGGINALASPSELGFARRIADAFGPDAKVVLANSGTEAVQVALRMARAYTSRQRVAKFEGHYHGFSDQGMVSSWFRYRGPAEAPEAIQNSAGAQQSVVEDTLVLQYGLAESLDRIAAYAHELACVVLEPMPSALAEVDAEFLAKLREVCEGAGVLVVYDEVVSGFRVHYGGAQHLAGVRPDLTCLGKVIGGGLPAGAVVGRAGVVDIAGTTSDPFLDVETRAFVGGTMSGNSITAAAGSAVLDHLRDNPSIYTGLDRRTEWLVTELSDRTARLGVGCVVKGGHSIFSITFDHARPKLVRDRLTGTNFKASLALSYFIRKHGVYLPELHTMMLSAAHTDADVERVADAFSASVADMADHGFFAV